MHLDNKNTIELILSPLRKGQGVASLNNYWIFPLKRGQGMAL
jgi:hypothetical protein